MIVFARTGLESWRASFLHLRARRPVRLVRFGADTAFAGIDRVGPRRMTTFMERVFLIRQRCPRLAVPDSGVPSGTSDLDGDVPIGLLSPWADPGQGTPKQGRPSPGPGLRHRPVLTPGERIEYITVGAIAAAIGTVLDERPSRMQRRPAATCEAA